MSVKRFDEVYEDEVGPDRSMQEVVPGAYVLFDDHAAELADRDATIARMAQGFDLLVAHCRRKVNREAIDRIRLGYFVRKEP